MQYVGAGARFPSPAARSTDEAEQAANFAQDEARILRHPCDALTGFCLPRAGTGQLVLRNSKEAAP
jgi:hypothetical protein